MKKIMKRLSIVFTVFTFTILSTYAHDDGNKSPDKMPPFGPHGGKYTKLTTHYAEVVVRRKKVSVYILERDIKNIAEDASEVSIALEIPKRFKKKIKLNQNKKSLGYLGALSIPKRARRVYFHIRCVLDGKPEYGKLLYEPNR